MESREYRSDRRAPVQKPLWTSNGLRAAARPADIMLEGSARPASRRGCWRAGGISGRDAERMRRDAKLPRHSKKTLAAAAVQAIKHRGVIAWTLSTIAIRDVIVESEQPTHWCYYRATQSYTATWKKLEPIIVTTKQAKQVSAISGGTISCYRKISLTFVLIHCQCWRALSKDRRAIDWFDSLCYETVYSSKLLLQTPATEQNCKS